MVLEKKVTDNEAYKKKHIQLLTRIGINYKGITPYILAFIHRSIVNERPSFAPEHNERLEFLWDAVLELVVTHKLFVDFPEKPEGELTDIRSAIVRWRNLSLISRKLWLSDYLILWNWERQWWGQDNDYILANTLEAFIWAIYIDSGYKDAESFILKHVYSSIDLIIEQKLFKDWKSLIQEYIQAKYDVTPTYKVLSEEWPDHNKTFRVWVYMNDKILWEGKGSSKKKAEEKAAEVAYNSLLT